MRLALAIFKYFPFGGLQRDMLRMAEAARRRGHAVTIFASRWEGPRPEGMEVRLLPVKAWTNHGAIDRFASAFRAAATGFDATVAFSRFPGADFYFAGDNCLAVEIAKNHSWPMRTFNPRYRTFLRHEREVMTAPATRVFYIAQRQKDDYLRVYGTPPERLIYLPPGLDDAFRHPDATGETRRRTRAELGLNDAQRMLLLVGSDFLRKGGDRAVRALAALPTNERSRCLLFLAGATDASQCRRLAEKLGVGEQTVFLGGRGDVPRLLQAADLMVHPARNECTGTVLLEAIVMGLPVLCSEECGFHDFVAAAGGKVLPMAAPPETLAAMIADALARLPELQESTRRYAANADFYRRADVAIDAIEEFARGQGRA